MKDLNTSSQIPWGVLNNPGPDIQWVQSFVLGDKMYCVYIAADAETVREYASLEGLPPDSVYEVFTAIDPDTEE